MNSDKKHISIIVLCCVFLVPINGLVHAQDWLILKSDNMIGDRLISQTNTIWPISDDSLKTNIIQQISILIIVSSIVKKMHLQELPMLQILMLYHLFLDHPLVK
jgi:hypothetical protein